MPQTRDRPRQDNGGGHGKSGRVTAVFGGIVLVALGGVDYGAAANARPEGSPLSLTQHIMDRFATARVALGLASPPASAAQSADTAPTDIAAVASGDQKAVLAAAGTEAAKVAAGIEDAPKSGHARARGITVGIGSCAKRGAGKFCSVGAD